MRQREDPGRGRVAGLRSVWTGNPRAPRCCQKGLSEAPAGAAGAGTNDGVNGICWWCWEGVALGLLRIPETPACTLNISNFFLKCRNDHIIFFGSTSQWLHNPLKTKPELFTLV